MEMPDTEGVGRAGTLSVSHSECASPCLAHLRGISLLPLAPLNRLPFPPFSISCQGLIGLFLRAEVLMSRRDFQPFPRLAASLRSEISIFFFKCDIKAVFEPLQPLPYLKPSWGFVPALLMLCMALDGMTEEYHRRDWFPSEHLCILHLLHVH